MTVAQSYPFFDGLDFLELERRTIAAPHIPKIAGAHDTSNFAEVASDSDDSDDEEGYQAQRAAYQGERFYERFPAFGVVKDSEVDARARGRCDAFDPRV